MENISVDEAIRLIKGTSKYDHALLVSLIMAEMAKELGEDTHLWKIVGLLHDLDYDEVKGDMERHGVVAAEKLRGKLPEDAIYAIKAHDYRTGFKPKSRLDKALIAADSAAILIEKLRKTPRKKMSIKTLQTELVKSSKTQPWLNENILKCVEIGLTLKRFFQLCLKATKQSN
jgi:hypothetical protein